MTSMDGPPFRPDRGAFEIVGASESATLKKFGARIAGAGYTDRPAGPRTRRDSTYRAESTEGWAVPLYLDEFQDFLRLPVDPEDMLAKARGFGLGVTLAHQHLNQLPTRMRQAVLANARPKVIF